MTKDELISQYTEKLKVAMESYGQARRMRHEATDLEIKRSYHLEQEYYSARKHSLEEILSDLRCSRWGM